MVSPSLPGISNFKKFQIILNIFYIKYLGTPFSPSIVIPDTDQSTFTSPDLFEVAIYEPENGDQNVDPILKSASTAVRSLSISQVQLQKQQNHKQQQKISSFSTTSSNSSTKLFSSTSLYPNNKSNSNASSVLKDKSNQMQIGLNLLKQVAKDETPVVQLQRYRLSKIWSYTPYIQGVFNSLIEL